MLSVISNLGSIHRVCLFENIALKNGLASKGVKDSVNRSVSPEVTGGAGTAPAAPNGDISGGNRADWEVNGSSAAEGGKSESPQEQNARALRHLASQIPNTLAPFFQGTRRLCDIWSVFAERYCVALGRTLSYVIARRSHDATLRQQATTMSITIAEVMLKHLTDGRTGE